METEAQSLWARYKRMGAWGLAAAALAVVILLFAAPQIMVGVWKLTLIASAAFAGYWIDRAAFPYARPHTVADADNQDGVWTKDDTLGIVFAACMLRRALVMAAVMVAMATAL